MPISRKKTCVQCRKAKARCSLTLPRCTRCIDKSLACDYARMVPYSVTTPASPATNANTHPGDLRDAAADLRVLTASNGHHSHGLPPGSAHVLLDSLGMVSSSSSTPPLSSAAPMTVPGRSDWPLLHVDLGPDAAGLDTSAMPPIEPCQNVFSFLNSMTIPSHAAPEGVQDEDTRLRNPITGSGTQSDFLLHDVRSRILTKRRGLNATTVLSTRAILGQVCAYPAMMVKGPILPPFIHSRCSLDDSLTHDCAKAQKHNCLRRTLSICASLVGMWLDKTPVNSPFVWETIYNEVARLQKEHEAYDSETLLESVQALTVYLLLQAQDTETLAKNDVKFLLITLGEIGQKMHTTLGYNTVLDTIETPFCRSTWVLYESSRRTLCLLYVVEMFLEVTLRQHEARCCQSFANAPLPCTRELWEVPSTYEWSKRYAAFLRGRAVDKILTLADYKLSHQLSAEELVSGTGTGEGGGSITQDVIRWCEGLDQFGTLISLAATLVKYENGPSIIGSHAYNKIA
ncbi:hypothetical protein THAR02_06382 [Trichoderma harzianum]|uniref:Zn(2)-C6 fungal-type domain-containing protein n=1 Tax=Trichoderma harzianum TaxID=5544 RepID=A0A0F9ZMQ4_TRIHA|nr:hypothetical protein THAR02_06382 [Trichoderma harzianum]